MKEQPFLWRGKNEWKWTMALPNSRPLWRERKCVFLLAPKWFRIIFKGFLWTKWIPDGKRIFFLTWLNHRRQCWVTLGWITISSLCKQSALSSLIWEVSKPREVTQRCREFKLALLKFMHWSLWFEMWLENIWKINRAHEKIERKKEKKKPVSSKWKWKKTTSRSKALISRICVECDYIIIEIHNSDGILCVEQRSQW